MEEEVEEEEEEVEQGYLSSIFCLPYLLVPASSEAADTHVSGCCGPGTAICPCLLAVESKLGTI